MVGKQELCQLLSQDLRHANNLWLDSTNAGGPSSRSKVWEALDREIAKPRENRCQIVSRWEFQPAAALYDRENRRNSRPRLWTADVYPVLPTECHGTHGIFREIIAQLNFWIFQESCKFPPQVSAYWQALLSALAGNATDCAASILLRISSSKGLALS